MRIGLLVCDHVRESLLAIEGDYLDMFERLLRRDNVQIESFDVVAGELPYNVEGFDGWIITGSRFSVFDSEPWIEDLAELTRTLVESNHKVFGVCFGHQMLARALGGEVRRSERGWGIGVREVAIIQRAPWMGEAVESYHILHSHRDQVEVLPPGAKVLASTDHCPVSMMAIGSNAVGIQGHPEYSREYARAALGLRRDRVIPGPLVDEALETFEVTPDREAIATWILNFFG